MPRQLSPAVRESITQTIRHTTDILLAMASDVELYSMLAGLSTLVYGALNRGPLGEAGTVPQPEQTSAQAPQGGLYL